MSRKDLNPKYQGKSTSELMKCVKDNRKYSPQERSAMRKEIDMRSRVHEDAGAGGPLGGAPGNNTRSVPGAGDDNSLRMRKARMFKKIYRRHNTKKEATKLGVREGWSANLYYLQPDGTYKKGGDGRSEGLTKAEVLKAGKKITEAKKKKPLSMRKALDNHQKIGYYEKLIKMAKTPEQKKKLQAKLDGLK